MRGRSSSLALLSLLSLLVSVMPFQGVRAISGDDRHALQYKAELYDPSCPPAGATTTFGPGSLPSSVPEPYNKIFTAAGTKEHVSPAFIAAIFYAGEHGNSFPKPPKPYGS